VPTSTPQSANRQKYTSLSSCPPPGTQIYFICLSSQIIRQCHIASSKNRCVYLTSTAFHIKVYILYSKRNASINLRFLNVIDGFCFRFINISTVNAVLSQSRLLIPGLTCTADSTSTKSNSLTVSKIRGLVHRLLRDMHVQERSLKTVLVYLPLSLHYQTS